MKFDIQKFWKNTQRNQLTLYPKAIALFCLLNIITLLPDVQEIYSSIGLISPEIVSEYLYPYSLRLEWILSPMQAFNLSEEVTTSIIIAIYMLSLCFVVFRYKTLFFSIVAWIIHLMLVNTSYFFSYGADYFINFGLFLVVLFTIINYLKDPEKKRLFSVFTIRLLQIHLCLVYLFAGFGKSLGTDWYNGNAVWYVLNNYSPNLQDEFSYFLLLSTYIFKIACWLTLFFEFFFPILIFYSRTRKITLFAVISMHIGIMMFMHLYTFGAIMILLDLIAFGHYFDKEYRILKRMFSNKIQAISFNNNSRIKES